MHVARMPKVTIANALAVVKIMGTNGTKQSTLLKGILEMKINFKKFKKCKEKKLHWKTLHDSIDLISTGDEEFHFNLTVDEWTSIKRMYNSESFKTETEAIKAFEEEEIEWEPIK